MNVEFEIQLIEALDALDRGESINAILARYPESAADLRPLLSTTAALPALRMQPSEAQKMKSRQAFLKQGAAMRQTAQRRGRLGIVPRLATMFAALSVACAVLGGGAVAASGSALPGDPLYGLKRTVENARLTFTRDAAARADLQAQFEAQRRAEVNALLDAGRETEVQLSGPIESMQPDAWVIGGLVVRVDANTQISGQPQLDRLADVRGLTGRTGLRALSITLDQATEPTPAAPEPTPTPTMTPAPTATPNPIVTPEPTEPRPTREPPTATPLPPKPVSIAFTGSVNSQTTDSWIIDGATVAIDANTVFKGNIGVGQRVTVQALRYANGRLLATQIELIKDDDGGGSGNNDQNGNSNDNQNSNDNNDDNDDNQNDDDDHNDNQNDNDDHNDNQNGNDNHNDDN